MRLPGFKRLQFQDFPKKYNDLTNILFNILNPFMEVVTQALSKRLTFDDNFDCLLVTVDISTPINNFKIANPRGGTFRGATIDYCVNKNDSTEVLTQAPFAQFTVSNDGQIVITNITGLSAGKTYTIRIRFDR